ncbi:YgaP family membrane protein [Aeromicrobium sp.]|uniref:YgaP family membrane protein n=1 Tax=Aeromicrobium sp. TaxID=1871063 RepID=UPI002FCC82F6
MNIDRAVLALAGTLILLSTLLAAALSPWWLLLTTFVGLNLLQSSLTGFCPAATIFTRLGLSPGCAFDPGATADLPTDRRIAGEAR